MESQRTTSRASILICLLGLLTAAAWSEPARATTPDALSDWNSRLTAARNHLIAGEHQKALDIARPLQHEMTDRIESGPGAGKALAMTVLSRALAEAGLGDMEAAAWDWGVARSLDPAIADMDLTPFGAAGAALKALGSVNEPEETPEEAAPTGRKKKGHVQRPELIQRTVPVYPDALQAICAEGSVLVESIIDEDGKIRYPHIKESPGGPIMALAALESLRSWRFKPATMKGKPVKVYYTLAVNFKSQAKSCLDRRKAG